MNTATYHSETLPWPYANAAALAYVLEHKLTPEPWESLRKQIADLPQPPVFALQAVRVLQGFWPQYAAECLAVLAKAVSAPLEVPDDELMLHVYCGFLLAEHRDPQCIDIAQQLLQLSWDDCEALSLVATSCARVAAARSSRSVVALDATAPATNTSLYLSPVAEER